MNYLEEIKNRSIFLWNALFDAQNRAHQAQPVYIDRAPVAVKTTGAQKPENTEEMHAAALQVQAGGTQGRVLRGIEEAEQVAKQIAERTVQTEEKEQGREIDAAQQESIWYLHDAESKTEATLTARGFTENPAQVLLEQVHAASLYGNAGKSMPNTARAETANTVQPMRDVESAAWSSYFERDARRYDGAYELM